ncbi:hypothetical protein HK102_002992 [Quaeritorhiza haematococci]|nr:hypothetical protein HK102_002992 [Quaeritorhiza haematococci]
MTATSPFVDRHGQQAAAYARFRPTYPPDLFDFLTSLTPRHDVAWDVGCGSGQASRSLAQHFQKVIATDPSPGQLAQAGELHRSTASIDSRITFCQGTSEDPLDRLGVPVGGVDLITVAQAIHWFDFDAFYANVRRAARRREEGGAVIAAWTYTLPVSAEYQELNRVLSWFYQDVLSPYWDPKARLAEQEYRTIPWPFDPIAPPPSQSTSIRSTSQIKSDENQDQNIPDCLSLLPPVIESFSCELTWDAADVLGYLTSWSGTNKFISVNGYDPVVEKVEPELLKWWPGLMEGRGPRGKGDVLKISYPIFLRVGRVYHGELAIGGA